MKLRDALSRQYRRLRATLNFYCNESRLPGFVPRGHFYSPLPDLSTTTARRATGELAGDVFPGINLNSGSQHETLLRIIEVYREFDWTLERKPDRRFYLNQGYFKQADAICMFALMRLFSPRRVIEVGSGFSSALMLDVNDQFLNGETQLTFIDPYPERLNEVLRPDDFSKARIITQAVQQVPLSIFEELQSNDILFIDSSHVSKTGSDVNYLYFEVFPRLGPGVVVHVHDIFWPFEYPREFIQEGHAWNEAYLIRAFLSFNANFEIIFWTPYAGEKWRDLIVNRMPAYMENTGASLWLRRTH